MTRDYVKVENPCKVESKVPVKSDEVFDKITQ